MTILRAARSPAGAPFPGTTGEGAYRPGVCNIGPYEIARRRRAGWTGIAVTIALAAVLLAADAPPVARLVVVLPLWGGLISLLQALRRFCVGFAFAGLENLGPDAAARRRVVDENARAADRRVGIRLILDGFLIAAPLAVAFMLLPV